MPKTKALVLFSGGLDSLLAIKVLELQNIEVTGLCFTSSFFSSASAEKTASANNVKLKIVDISQEILDLVKNPPSGYGKNLNPCIDCHGLMIRTAGAIMKNENYDIVATGEVLGQRPFSQNKSSLARVQKLAGVEVLRPLSAKLLEPTKYEDEGLVNRGRLLDISGRTREQQFELAKKFGITEFPTPAGGCLLTDPEFSGRMIKMLSYWPNCQPEDTEMLKHGRIFWFNMANNKKVLAIVGRDEAENNSLAELARQGDIMVELKKENGPTVLVRGLLLSQKIDSINLEIPANWDSDLINQTKKHTPTEILELVGLLAGYYATKTRGKQADIKINTIK